MARQRLTRPRYSIHDTAYRYVNNRLINPTTGDLIPYKETTRQKKLDIEALKEMGVPQQLIEEFQETAKLNLPPPTPTEELVEETMKAINL